MILEIALAVFGLGVGGTLGTLLVLGGQAYGWTDHDTLRSFFQWIGPGTGVLLVGMSGGFRSIGWLVGWTIGFSGGFLNETAHFLNTSLTNRVLPKIANYSCWAASLLVRGLGWHRGYIREEWLTCLIPQNEMPENPLFCQMVLEHGRHYTLKHLGQYPDARKLFGQLWRQLAPREPFWAAQALLSLELTPDRGRRSLEELQPEDLQPLLTDYHPSVRRVGMQALKWTQER